MEEEEPTENWMIRVYLEKWPLSGIRSTIIIITHIFMWAYNSDSLAAYTK